ncbi:sodium:calcium antiporter [Nocardioides sp. SYSU DS0663]|uniref:sodium:calcium antiporter n=1 Tax=Nocardioides sp. SYSU DS0663 TaxID=3416445 RepID=UPI003F4B4414
MLATMPLTVAWVLFAGCAAVIGVAGTRLAGVVDHLADRTGIGEAVAGAVLMGAVTSLSGSVLSVSAAWSGRPELAVSNAVGGIAVQTLFLAIADLAYRRANLEHAAASIGNMMQGALLMAQMSWLLVAFAMPGWTIAHVHVVTPLLLGSYLYGVHLVRRTQTEAMWAPASTRETRVDEPEEENKRESLRRLVVVFLGLAAALGVTGWLLERSAGVIAAETGLGQAIVGTLFTSTATSLPELVTTIAAVRNGALTLAVAGIIGGNAYDTLFAAFSDVAYLDGSIYQAVSESVVFWTALGALMTAVLLMGLIRREERGPGGIGFESVALFVLYIGGVVTVVATG